MDVSRTSRPSLKALAAEVRLTDGSEMTIMSVVSSSSSRHTIQNRAEGEREREGTHKKPGFGNGSD